jgi:hypothetical protein
MLTPLPPDLKNEFGPQGRKYLEIEHNGCLYILSSDKSSRHQHSFILNDFELNAGGTKSVQIELVKEHFNITQSTQSVLLGARRLTALRDSERRDLFADLSHIDYTYPMTIYTQTKNRNRDIIGGMRMNQESLQRLKNTVKTIEEQESIRLRVNVLSSLLGTLKASRTASNSAKNSTTDFSTEISRNIANIDAILSDKNLVLTDKNYCVEKLQFMKSENAFLQKSNENMLREHSKLVEKITTINIVDDTVERVKYLKNELGKLELNDDVPVSFNTYASCKMWLECNGDVVMEQLINVSSCYYVAEEYGGVASIVSGSVYGDKTIELLRVKEKNNTLKNREKYITSELEHLNSILNSGDKVTCPNCETSWIPNYDSEKHKKLSSDLVECIKDIALSDDEVKSIASVVHDMEAIRNSINTLSSIIRSSGVDESIRNVMLWLLDHRTINELDVDRVIEKMNILQRTLSDMTPYIPIYKELLEKEVLISETNKQIEFSTKTLESHIDRLDRDIAVNNLRISENNKSIDSLVRSIKKIETATELLDRMRQTVRKSLIYKKQLIAESEDRAIDEAITLIESELYDLNTVLRESDKVADRIAELNSEYEKLLLEEKATKELMNILSPTEGLIGRSISSFINVIITEMNRVIKSIWSYDIEIQECNIGDDGELDYLFPVKVDGRTIIADIGKMSMSMREVVDLAFKLVYIKYRKLDVPLVLDEFGSSMDTTHQINSYNIIGDKLVNNFNQIFIVSHFESMYGRFSNSDISILDSSNLTVDTYKDTSVMLFNV